MSTEFPQPAPKVPTRSHQFAASCAALAHSASLAEAPSRGGFCRPIAMDNSRRSVLVIDDDSDIRQTLAEVLRDVGHDVATARDGIDALGKLDSIARPCLILLDLTMPRMNGLEFLEHLSGHKHTGDFAVLVMSAHDALRREASVFPNVRGMVTKPFDFDGLISEVER